MAMDCSAVREELEAYALGALDVEEAARVQRHLSGCPACQQVLAQYEETLALLPEALAAVAPVALPPSLRGRLLERAANDMPRQPQMQHSVASAPDGWLARLWRRLVGGRKSLLRTYPLPVALMLLLMALFGWSISLNVTLARERSLRAEFANLVDQQELVLEVVDSNKTIRRVLLPPEKGPAAYGKLYTRSDMAHVVVMVARLETPVPDAAYHLWVVKGQETLLAGLLTINAEGFGLLLYDEREDNPVFDEILLTLQPVGGTTPKLPPVLVWRSSP